MWVSVMMSYLWERIEQMTEPGITDLADDGPNEDDSLAEKIPTRITGALALLAFSFDYSCMGWLKVRAARPRHKHANDWAWKS